MQWHGLSVERCRILIVPLHDRLWSRSALGLREEKEKTLRRRRLRCSGTVCYKSLMFHTLKTFMTSSPRWLMTLTAIRPDLGLSKGLDVSLLRVAQASALISAFNVVFRAE